MASAGTMILQKLVLLFVWFGVTVNVGIHAFQPTGINDYIKTAIQVKVPSSSFYISKRMKLRCNAFKQSSQGNHEEEQQEQNLPAQEASVRRTVLKSIFLASNAVTATTTVASASTPPAPKAKGAAEYDFEYYMRDLFKGNNKEGNMTPSKPPPTPPSRKMAPASFIRSIIDENCTGDCIAVNQLAKLLSPSSSEIDIETTSKMVSNKISSFREKVQNVFYVKEPWVEESIVDEYYFDLTCYALFRTAAELIPTDYRLRDLWVRNIGREMYQLLQKEGMVVVPSIASSSSLQLTDIIPSLIQIMDSFQSSNFIKGYRLGEKNDDVRTGKNIFDEYDNDDINSNTSVNMLLSVFRPATLGSSLQITGEGSRFSTDLISPTLVALFQDTLGLKVEYEGYFVDEEYRPNPKDFFPDEQLLQFTLKKK